MIVRLFPLRTYMSDTYYICERDGQGKVTEKMSRFLSFTHTVTDEEEARALVKDYQNKYHDARHVCWAYMLGAQRERWQLNDNGEPSGTAGKPILGQINSFGLTNILVVVVRYFGGIKLGTPGLIAAYREAARLAIEDAGKKECHRMIRLEFSFPYISMNSVMKIVKGYSLPVVAQEFDNSCSMTVDVVADQFDEVFGRLASIEGVSEHSREER